MTTSITNQLEFPVILIQAKLPKEADASLIEMIYDHHLPTEWDRVGEVYVTDTHVGALCMKEIHYA